MTTFTYFAFRSNMLDERLQDRCPSARSVGLARAPGFYICFEKCSKDKSGKVTLVKEKTVDMEALGVLFEIDEDEHGCLNEAEKGYDPTGEFIVIRLDTKKDISVTTYLANTSTLVDCLFPYDWYLALIVAGAIQHHLPDEYITMLDNGVAITDKNLERTERCRALAALCRGGYMHLYTK